MASQDIQTALDSINGRIKASILKNSSISKNVLLVAVSKTKPNETIIEAYKRGQRYFGENYVNELADKASDPEITAHCPEIKWCFIGHLQSNKINKLLNAQNLHMIQTVDSEKLADGLDKCWSKLLKQEPLKIMVQVNTSGELNKSGIIPEKTADLVSHILLHCPHLKFIGLMTIGALNHDLSLGVNPDFEALSLCRKNVSEKIKLDLEKIELSMGMSHDFEHAIEMGSTCVRVGSSIFGTRIYPKNNDDKPLN